MKRTFTSLLWIITAIGFLQLPTTLSAQNIYLYAGSAAGTGGYTGDGTGLTSYELDAPHGLAWDRFGNMYIADYTNNRIRKVSGTTITTIAGNGSPGFAGDGSSATAATCEINGPTDVTTDYAGNVYFSDYNNNRIRKISTTGIITTIAGNGTAGYGGDGGAASAATCELNLPVGVVVDRDGNLFIGDQFNNRIRRISPSGIITTVAGTGTGGFSGDGSAATAAKMEYPMFLRFDMWGNLFFEDRENNRIRTITPAGIINTVAGFGTSGFAGDGTPATNAEFSYIPGGIRFDGAGNLYIGDGNNYNVRKITAINGHIAPSDIINSIAGTHTIGFTGDTGPATAATFRILDDVLLDSTGNIYVADEGNNVVRFIDIRNTRPRFTGGTLQSLSVCENSTYNSINSLLSVIDTNTGQTITWNLLSGPSHGTVFANFSTIASGSSTAMTPTGLSYTPITNFSGKDTFIVWVNDGHSLDTTEIIVTVKSFYAGLVTPDPVTMCPGNTVPLSSDTIGGTWSSSNADIASVSSSGIVKGLTAGNVAISYTISNSCGSATSMSEVRVGNPIITTYAGNGTAGYSGFGVAATSAEFNDPHGLSVDPTTGYIYIADQINGVVRKIDPSTGIITTIAGTGTSGYTGDGIATAIELHNPWDVLADGLGNVYVTDAANYRVRKINSSGIITTIAGIGTSGSLGDGTPATGAELNQPCGITMDASGNIYIGDIFNSKIRKIDPSGIITTFAGTGTTGFSGDGGPATAAEFNDPNYLRIDPSGNLIIIDNGNQRIRKINKLGIISTIVGTGAIGSSGDGGPATSAALNYPGGVAFDAAGNMYIACDGNQNVRMVNNAGIISTIAGPSGTSASGYSGDGGPPTAAKLFSVLDVAFDASGNLFIAEQGNNVIRKIITANPIVGPITGGSIVCPGATIPLSDDSLGGTWSSATPAIGTVSSGGDVTGISAGVAIISYAIHSNCGSAGTGTEVTIGNPIISTIAGRGPSVGDGGPATAAKMVWPTTICFDASGNLLVTDYSDQRVRKINTAGTISTIAGNGTAGDGGDGSAATTATVSGPAGICTDVAGNIYIAEQDGCRIRKINTSGFISTIAGNGTCAYSSDGIAASAATLNQPTGVAVDNNGNIYIAEWSAGLVRKINPSGILSTFAGGGGSVVDGVPATTAALNAPYGLSLDGLGNLFVSEENGFRVREISLMTNTIITYAGTGTSGYSGDNGLAHNADLTYLGDPYADGYNVYIGDANNEVIRKVNRGTDTITTIAGNNTLGYSGDGGPATGAECYKPSSIAIDAAGNIYFAESGNHDIRKITPTNPTVSPISGPSTLCPSSTINLTDVTSGGIWSSSNAVVATVGTGGVVLGNTDGTSTIDYTVNFQCGPVAAPQTVTVNTIAAITPVSSSICTGGLDTLTDATGGGVWSTTSSGVVSVGSSSGIVAGLAVGVATITYSIGTCYTLATVTVNTGASPISPSSAVICSGSSVLFSESGGSGTWSVSNSRASISGGGLVTGSSTAGIDTIIFTEAAGGCFASATVTVEILTPVSPNSASICVGNMATITDPTGGGVWSASNSHATVISGTVTGASAGVDTISYTLYSGTTPLCSSTATVNVNASPTAISPSSSAICMGTSATLTDGVFGGSWTISNSHATSSGGFITGVSTGVDTVTYTIGTCSAKATVTVVAAPAAISPSSTTVCTGHTVTLTDGTGSGSWSASNSHGSVSGGVVTGVTAGVDTIVYSVGSCSVSATVTVNASPSPISPSSSTVCAGSLTSLTDPTGSGSWSSSNGHASVTGGTVTGSSPGLDTISYTVSGCATTAPVTVNITPTNISPSTASVCTGSTVTLTDGTGGGAWTSSNTNASVVGGTVTGLTSGVDTISYTLGTCTVTAVVTINASPSSITPSGVVSVCIGTTTPLTDASSPGTWSSGATGTATVNSSGVVSGVGVGTATISFTNTLGCSALKAVNVISNPAAISPASSNLCIGSNVTLTDATGGGVWSISNSHATIAGNTATGVSTGVDTVYYTVGSCFVTATLTVNPVPLPISPSTGISIRVGATTSLTDATGGGTWSSSSIGTATVGTSGTVTGTGAGNVTISYTNSFGCAAIKVVTISVTPTALSPSTAIVCVGHIITLTDGVSGGTWASSSTNATVASGGVTGVTVGTAIISYTIGSCYVTALVSVNPSPSVGTITGPTVECVGSSMSLIDGAIGGGWSSSNVGVATVGSSSGSVLGISAGTAIISYSITNGCGLTSTSTTVTINAIPTGGTITGPSSVCSGTTNPYTDGVSGGVWTTTNSNASITGTGLLTAITPGLDTIKYTVTNTCGTALATKAITIGAFLTAGSITGANSVCQGAHITLTDLAPAGIWSSTNTAIATVGTSGIVTGVSGGVDTVSYTVSASCGTANATHTVTVNPLPNAGSISGSSALCVGMLATYTDTASGGTWSVTNTHATITGAGLVTAATAGTDTIKYTVTNSCGTAVATQTVSIGATLTAGSITGAGFVCAGSSTPLTDATTGGVWSSSNGDATVGLTGMVTGVAAGLDTISYTVTASCGTAVATHTVLVNPLPNAGSITGPSAICTGATTTYTESAGTGTWSMSNSIATITSGGVLNPLTSGMDTIRYTVSNSCGTAVAILPVTIGATLSAGTLTGPGVVCIGSSITLTASSGSGGTWSASNGNATVAGGVVTGVATGTDVINYTVSGSCGTSIATTTVAVSPAPAAGSISGPSVLCTGTTTTYTNAATGGTWSISNSNATITGGGAVTAITVGMDTISYTATTGCGTATATKAITIGASVTAGSISGPGAVCTGSIIPLTDAATGGTWSSSNTHASVSGSGVVTGVTGGVDTISYTVSSSCGTAAATATVTVSPVPVAGSITGPASLCVGTYTLYTDTAAGTAGIWSSSNASATIASSGVVTAVTTGTDTISYTTTNACGTASASQVISISPSTGGGSISGPTSVCAGGSISLTGPITGGTWSSLNANAAVGALTGVVTGLIGGTDIISYSVTTACGLMVSSTGITIEALPSPGTITGGDSVCVSGTLALSDAVGGGTWSSGSANATITSSGLVSGVSSGTAPISYAVTNSCGTSYAVLAIAIVSTTATSGTIVGSSEVCVGSGITLTDATPGGSWFSSNANASVAGPGIIDGVSIGIDTVFYIVSNVCGSSEAFKILAVDPVPIVMPISGPTTQCTSTTISLIDAITGGVGTSSNPAVANIGLSSGVVTGVSSGTATITYTVTNIYGCPASVVAHDAVVAAPSIPAITGSINVCIGSSIALSDAITGGTWSSGATGVATIDASGNVTGISAGLATITYSVINLCGTEFVTRTETVSPPPTVAAITGTTHQCMGASTTLDDATTGGTWSSSNVSIATVGSASGMVTGIGTGTVTINYTYTGPSGCSLTIGTPDSVATAPTVPAITGITNECIGGTNLLSNSTPGGTWSSSAPFVATIDATGLVAGISAGSVTINYSVSNLLGCTTTVTTGDTVNTIPVPSAIGGTLHVCDGANTTLTNPISGGIWSSGSPAVATVSSSTGVVTGAAAGTTEIYYSISNSCGAAFDSARMTVNAAPTVSAITAIYTNLCSGTSAHLSETATGGVWSSSDATIASVSSAGIVTGNTAGSAIISYTVTNSSGCEGSATIAITVGSAIPSATVSPAGSATLCHGHTVYMYVVTSGTGLTYQWLRNGGTITGATNMAYTTGTAGNYSVVVSNGICSETITGTNVVAQPNPVISFTAPDILHTGSFASYQWLFNGVAIPGAIGSAYNATVAGVYKVVVMDGNGCTDTSAGYTISNPGTNGVNNIVVAADIKVYPNPATATLHIDAPANVNVTILSVDGKELITQKNATSIDISSLANGMYLVMIYDENGILIKTAKFAKIE